MSHTLRLRNRISSSLRTSLFQQSDSADTSSVTSLSGERSVEREEHTGRKKIKTKRKHRQTQGNASDTDSEIEPKEIAETNDETQNEPICVYFRDQLHVFTTGKEKEHDGLHLNDMEVLKHRALPETKPSKIVKRASFSHSGPFFVVSTESGSTDLSDEFHRPYEAEPDEDLF